MTQTLRDELDVVGVGVGPFNLSLAALLSGVPDVRANFFERDSDFQWHPGLLLPEATIQTSFLKDLVTLADPTHRYSFLAFLAAHKRLYRFIVAEFPSVLRCEFNEYLRWVAGSLTNLRFGERVSRVELDEAAELLVVHVGKRLVRTRNLVVGSGLQPHVPACAAPFLGDSVVHAVHFLKRAPDVRRQRVAVIGGGQTGAEIVHYLLGRSALPEQLIWVSRRSNFLPLDETPFTNELFTPGYSDHFFGLSDKRRAALLAEQKLASDGIAPPLLQALYQQFYRLDLQEPKQRYRLLPAHELVEITREPRGWGLALHDGDRQRSVRCEVDQIILATGFRSGLPAYLDPLESRIPGDSGGFDIRADFSLVWNGPARNRIFVQNGVSQARGIADANLSLMAWRSAVIANALAGRSVFDVGGDSSALRWGEAHA